MQRDDFEETENETTGTVVQSIDDLRNMTEKLQKERQNHLNAAKKIEESLAQFRDQLNEVLENTEEESNGNSVNNAKRGRGRPKKNRSQGNGRAEDGRANNKGRPPGKRGRKAGGNTAIIESILRKNDGKMPSGDLASEAKKQGVKFPHSAFQSLKKRGMISLKDHLVTLNKSDDE